MMDESFEKELKEALEMFNRYAELFELSDSNLSLEQMRERIDIELEEFVELEGPWTISNYQDLSVTITQLFTDEFNHLIEHKEYDIAFFSSRYLFKQLLSLGSSDEMLEHLEEVFKRFNKLWKLCRDKGYPELKEVIDKWISAES
ncbi:hypothetical protein [Vagococcus xieshaowenii]|uniref:Uncharacterized protein n=1 Tax=Vagococcus xieshaowenii TaxID=2562451 RepID=A0AAJ5JM00_9ENTE|nr:hypothetical protein [Vagococcus xieshaowenii]QCA28145.1 hypothetical protein E4Z98_02020 [Vagococcus xieshaowenii]TFZ39729.1 hypothetical protein E4031_08550 [Vagococcus xieshaowenii]